MEYFLLVPLFAFIYFLHQCFFIPSNTQKRLLPPSPTKLPIIGNLHQLGSLPHRSLHKLSKKYGPVMLLHFGNLRDVLSGMTNNIISRVNIGRTYNEGESVFNIGDYIPWLKWLNKINGLDSIVKKVAKDLDSFLESVIEERLIRNKKGECSVGEAIDFVGILLEIQNGKETGYTLQTDSLKALLLDAFVGGTESVYTSLEWTMTELLMHPRVLKKLEDEVRELGQGKTEITEDDIGNMHYLKAVIKESLRLHPPNPLLLPRESREDVKLLDYDIPAKTQGLINAWAMGRDPLLWGDPEEYRPERFLNSDIDVKGQNFELIPFGAGRRGCPGMTFAIIINELALARIVHKFNLALSKEEDLDMTECNGLGVRRKLPLLAWFFRASNTQKRLLPPSPTKLPIIGNLHQLGSLPHRSLHQLSNNYGPLMLLHFGSKPVLIASSVDAARDIMKTHDLVWSNRPKSSMADGLFYGSKDMAFSPYGEYWRQIRSVMVLHLLSNKRVQSYRYVREEETSNMIDKIRRQCDFVIDLRDVLSCMTNNIISRVAIGRTYNEGESGIDLKTLLEEILMLVGTFNVGDYIPWLKWLNKIKGLDTKVKKVAKDLDAFLESVIEERVIRNKKAEYSAVKLKISWTFCWKFRMERRLDAFVAGTDSTYTVLEWTMTELLRHPRIMKKLEDEVRELGQGKTEITEDDLGNMDYLKAVIKESLRLHAPVPLLVARESMEEVKLLDYNIPAKTEVLINAWGIGRDPLLWDDPEEYKPERFLNSNIDVKGLNFELIPFGAGRRGCPGIPFAIMVNELALANLVHKFNFALPKGIKGEDLDMTECNGLAVRRKSPLLVCFFSRSNTQKRLLPPSPTKLPIIGNLHQLGSLPHRSLHKLSKKYGPLMLLHFGSKPVLVASSVDAARDIISVTVLHLLNNKRVQSYRHVREEEISNMIDKIRQECDSLIDLRDVLSGMTNNIISRVNIGRTYNEGESGIAVKALLEEITLGVIFRGLNGSIKSMVWTAE
ncbi:hypothetical protein H5410_017862 [Solanum commersonii]|uniref:Cytochrome P450 n=1 Tax=Solanum commersonii TaxID=4109 RepID=A0A9J6A099_SOLCO|nr:hypothetical protein H5410_017862 [Solanum commersonii]